MRNVVFSTFFTLPALSCFGVTVCLDSEAGRQPGAPTALVAEIPLGQDGAAAARA